MAHAKVASSSTPNNTAEDSAPLDRRSFIKTTAVGASALGTLGGFAVHSSVAAEGTEASKSPNEQPVVAFVGTGIRFHTALGRQATDYGPCASVCDVDLVQAGRAYQVCVDQHRKHGHPINIDFTQDYRHVLDRDDVDAVIIGTPDHWHTKIAIEAMQAGKDVYCEKPLTLTIREGRQILDAIEQTGKVVQVGTQQRTEFGKRFAKAVAMMHDNRVGDVKRVTVAIGGSLECDPMKVVDAPKQIDWDMWQGQAPTADYIEGPLIHPTGWGAGFPLGRTHNYFRWFYEYSGGKLTDWGAHHVDIAMWALNKLNGDIGPIEIDPIESKHPVPFEKGHPTESNRFNAATSFKVSVKFKDGLEMMVRNNAPDLGFGNGVMFEGSEGRFLVNRGKLVGKPVERLEEKPLPEDAMEKLYGGAVPKSHMGNFFECVKTRATPASDVESHHRMLSICHAVNIAMRLGRKLTFDPQQEQFVGDAEANTFVEREQRKGYEIKV